MPKKAFKDIFVDGRVALDPVPPTPAKKATIMYKGLLAQCGADAVYVHSGYGYDVWKSVKTTPMTKLGNSIWSIDMPVEGEGKFNFCFKDSANNWDNNSGLNWGCEIG